MQDRTRPPEQADRADEIARELVRGGELPLDRVFTEPTAQMMQDEIAAALRSYRNDALEEAAQHCDGRVEVIRQVRRIRKYPKETAATDAAGIRQAGFCARIIRSLKSKEPQG